MIDLRVATELGDLEAWAAIKSRVAPDEPVTAEQLVATDEPGRVLLLAEVEGVLAGCGIGGLSSFGDKAYIMARVLPEHRRRGVGSALVRSLAEHGRALGRNGVNSFVESHDDESIRFAEKLGLAEVDYQLEQVRPVGDEVKPVLPAGVGVVAVGDRRTELLVESWPLAQEGYEDMPLPGSVTHPRELWLRDEASRPDGSFVAFENGEVVGYAGMLAHANGDATAEHGLTVVRRDRRRRGIARGLKLTQLHWAASNGVVELVTWTQKGNEAMQALNASLGYVTRSRALTMQGPIP